MNILDSFTLQLFEVAFDDLKRSKREITPQRLRGAVECAWFTYRDTVIETWAGEINARVPQKRLIQLNTTVFVLLSRMRQPAEMPCGTASDTESAWFSAYGLAGLRWLHREIQGRVPLPRYTDDQLSAWLSARQPAKLVQLALF